MNMFLKKDDIVYVCGGADNGNTHFDEEDISTYDPMKTSQMQNVNRSG